MKNRVKSRARLWWLWIASILAAGSATAFAWMLQLHPQIDEVQLPDERTAQLMAYTTGTSHDYVDGPLWKQLLQRAFPHAGTFQGSILHHSTPEPALGLWVRLDTASDTYHWALDDGHGCRFDETFPDVGDEATDLLFVPFSCYPRRGDPARLIYQRDHGGESSDEAAALNAVLNFRSPHGQCPDWLADPYPISRVSGDVTFTLTRLIPDPAPHALPNDRIAVFQYAERGQEHPEWQPASVSVEDATGNQRDASHLPDPRQPDRIAFGGLCSHENAWKLSVLFARTLHTRVPPDWIWTVHTAPIPFRSDSKASPTIFQAGAIRLVFGKISTVTDIGPEPGPYQYYSVSGVGNAGEDGIRISLIRVRDQLGRDLTIPLTENTSEAQANPWTTSQVVAGENAPIRDLPVRTLLDSRTLDLTFAIYRGRTAEFVVKP